MIRILILFVVIIVIIAIAWLCIIETIMVMLFRWWQFRSTHVHVRHTPTVVVTIAPSFSVRLQL